MNIKKLTVGTLTAILTGTTAFAGAFAAEGLSNYVQSGSNGVLASPVIVIGSNAGSATEYPKDVAAAGDIAAHVAGYATTVVDIPGTSLTTATGGISLATSSSELYLNDKLNKAKNVLSGNDLPELLGSDSFTDDTGKEYSYSQYIEIGDAVIQFSKADNEGDPVVHIDTSSTTYTARIVFNKPIDFTDENIRGQNIEFFGNEYMIGFESDNTEIKLFGTGNEQVVSVGGSVTASVGGIEHFIEVSSIADSETAVIIVDGKLKEVVEGRSYTFSGDDGVVDVFVKGVYFSASESGISQVELVIGSNELSISNGNRAKIGDDSIDGTQVTFFGNGSVSKIDISVEGSSDKESIVVGESLIDPVFKSFEVAFLEYIISDVNSITIDSSGRTAILSITDYRGFEKTFDIAYFDGSTLRFGDQNGVLVSGLNANVSERDYIILGPETHSEFTHMFKLTNIDIADNEFTLQDVVSGISEIYQNGTFYVDGHQYNAAINNTIVRFSGYNDTAMLKLQNGEFIGFDSAANQVVMTHEDDIEFRVDVMNTTSDITLKPNTTIGFVQLESNSDKQQLLSAYGTLFTYNTNDEGMIVVFYPEEQTVATVLVGANPEIVLNGTDEQTIETTYHITQPIVKLDNELIGSAATYDMILIGGPCANTLVATLLAGDGITCNNWPYTTGLIKEVENAFGTGQKALIIAGTTADNTRQLAAQVMQGTMSYEA